MPLQEVVILNPSRKSAKRKGATKSRSKASRKKRSSASRRKTGGKSMATRRKSTAARKTRGRRKTTSRRRTTRRKSSPRRRTTKRKATTRRRTTRRKSPARRKTTTRRRRATRRKPTTRRKTTRRKTTRRKSPARRKTTRRKRRTTRRKPTTRRRRTSRRKAGTRRRRTTRRKTARRKSGRRKTARRKTARRKSGVRGLMSRRRGSKMSLKGFKSFVKDHLAGRALGITALGLVLPSLGIYAATRLNLGSMVSRVPVLNTVMGNPYGRAALGATVTAGISYLAMGAGLLGRNEAIMANSIALVLFGLNAMRNAGHLPAMITDAVPSSSSAESGLQLFGYGGSYMNGYGGYLGYLGNATEEDEPVGELFGYNSAPQVNVF